MSSRLRRIGEFAVVLLALAFVQTSSAGAALPGGYAATPVDNPATATAGDHFGENVVNAGDVTGDGRDDLIVGVPDAPGDLPGITGKVVFVDGSNGGILATVRPPNSDTLISHKGAPTAFGAQVATIGDLGSDGVPEHVVSAPGSDITSAAVDQGIVYVLDGQTNQILKRIELDPDDRPASAPGFGKRLASAIGEPACAPGFGGTGSCPDAPSSLIARGDLDGGGKADIVIGAPDYQEDAPTETNPVACPSSGPSTCPGLGRVYVFSGEDVTGSAGTPLVTPLFRISYWDSASASQQPRLGGGLAPVGDVGSCNVSEGAALADARCPAENVSSAPDGYPDFIVSAPGLDVSGATDAGVVYVVDGHKGDVIGVIGPNDPQQDAGFGPLPYGQTVPGNMGGSALPDIYLASLGQDLGAGADQGRGYVLNGDVFTPNVIVSLDDPAPTAGGGFGTFTGLGDAAGDDGLNELAAGRSGGGPVEIVSSCGPTQLLTIEDQEPGGRFGAAIAPMGDLNGDGLLDLAVGAPGHDADKGRVYLMKSSAPGSNHSCRPPAPPGGGGGGGGGGSSPGVTPTQPPSLRKQTSSLAKRRIVFKTSKKKVRVAQLLKLSGKLKALKRKKTCQGKQKVAIQRFAGNNFWQTIDVAVTKRDGSFVVSVHPAPAQLFQYRARVNQTRRCRAATSKSVTIKAV